MDTNSQESASGDGQLVNSTLSGDVLPRFRGRRPSLRSLTGTCRESASLYVCWKHGLISRSDYLTGVRGLSVHKDVLVALESERTRQYAESVQQQMEQLTSRPAPQMNYGDVDCQPAEHAAT